LLSDRSIAAWTVLAGMAGVLALVLTVTRLGDDDPPAVVQVPAPATTAPGVPGLRLAAFAADRTAEIDAEFEEPGGGATRGTTEGAVLDISLRNDGDLPVLVTAVRVTLRQADELPPCSPVGGISVISARYDVAVPVPPPPVPTRLDRPVRFEVLPRSLDRFTVSLGPAAYGLSGYVYVAEVELVHDGAQRLPVGRAAVVAPPRYQPAETILDTACAARARDALDRAAATRGEVSPRVAALRSVYAAAAG
jgi:hypothetical protein